MNVKDFDLCLCRGYGLPCSDYLRPKQALLSQNLDCFRKGMGQDRGGLGLASEQVVEMPETACPLPNWEITASGPEDRVGQVCLCVFC